MSRTLRYALGVKAQFPISIPEFAQQESTSENLMFEEFRCSDSILLQQNA